MFSSYSARVWNHGMTSARRIGAPDAKNRGVLLDAAEQLMLEEGYAAVTSRRVAERADLKPQLVHYYFRTMDDLYLELVGRGAKLNQERQAKALASDTPLRELWAVSTDPAGGILNIEFSALANHRKAIRAELVKLAEEFRKRQTEAFAAILTKYGISHDELSPEALAFRPDDGPGTLNLYGTPGIPDYDGIGEDRIVFVHRRRTGDGPGGPGDGPGVPERPSVP